MQQNHAVRRFDATHLAASAEFFESRAGCCHWLAGHLNWLVGQGAAHQHEWEVFGDAYRHLATTQAAVNLENRLGFLGSSDIEGTGFEAVSDHLAASHALRKLIGGAEAVTAHLVNHPEWHKRVRRQHGQLQMRLYPDALRVRPPRITRPARAADLPALRRHERIYGAERQVVVQRDYAQEIEAGCLFVAEEDGVVKGVVKLGYPTAHTLVLIGTFVFPEFRGMHLGSGMVADVCERVILGLGLDVVLTVDDDNDSAVHVYERVGFTTTGRERIVYLAA